MTGAGSGIGRATASRMAREGGRVIAVDTREERLEEFAAEHEGAEVTAVTANMTKEDDIARVVEAAGTHRRPRERRGNHGQHDPAA